MQDCDASKLLNRYPKQVRMGILDLGNVWLFVSLNVILWIVISTVVDIFFFDWQFITSVLGAIPGGIASGLVLYHIRQTGSEVNNGNG